MALFGKQRNDGNLIDDGYPIQHIMPYVMKGRNESTVYLKKTIDIENVRKYVRKQRRAGKRITVFNVVVTAVLCTIYRRPHLNRFIAGRRMYEHKVIDVLYVVKRDLTDEAEESIAKVVLSPEDNIFTVAEKMSRNIEIIQKELEEKKDDKFMSFLQKLPRWTLRSIVSIVRWLDFHGILPAKVQDSIPLYSTVYLSHIGSLGAEAPFHHLYEFGTTSLFITVGKFYDQPRKAKDGSVEWYRAVDLMFTVDERICDGFYLIKSLRLLEDYLINPESMEISPAESERREKEANMAKKKQQEQEKAEKAELFVNEPVLDEGSDLANDESDLATDLS
ncbi:MAG: hypothetical protein Q4E09_05850 [Eubacteriales bacterium]|nr:hypothetical protein [Eubacteriales bacterium]